MIGIMFEAETKEILQETVAVAQEVAQDIEKLKPNAMVETVKSWLPGLMSLGYRLLIVLAIWVIGTRLIGWLKKLLAKTFTRMGFELSIHKFLLSLSTAAMYLLLLLIAADRLGFNPASMVALVGSAGVAIALSLQGSLANFAGGIVILVMKPFRVGDYIQAQGMEGTVASIGLIYTAMLTVDHKSIMIPNGGLANSAITNVTAQEYRRVDISVGISYDANLLEAKKILMGILQGHPLVSEDAKKDRICEVFVSELADSAVMLGGRCWTETSNYWKVKFDVTEAMKLAFDDAGIEIPYNKVDVTIKEQLQTR